MTQQECLYFDNMEKIGIKHKHMFWIFSVCYFFDMMDMNLFGSIAASVQATFALTNGNNDINFRAWLQAKSGRDVTIGEFTASLTATFEYI